jgi:hypothetical protein
LGIVATATWAAALFFPALRADGRVIQSIEVLAFGWIGPLLGGYFEWMANPFLIFAALLTTIGIRNTWVLAVLGIFEGGLLVRNATLASFPANEAGDYAIQARYLGWYLWMAAQGIMVLAVALSLFEHVRSARVTAADRTSRT